MQDHSEDLRRCAGGDDATAAQARIDSCSALISSGANTGRGVARLLAYRADAHHRAGDPGKALADLNEAIRLDPRRCCAPYEARGMILAMMGEGDAAVRDYDRAAQGMRDRAAANNARCWGRALAGADLDRARRFCDGALRLRPAFGAFLDSRGLVGLKQARFEDAWSDYNEALRWAPDEAQYLYGRGIAALRLGRAPDGEADIAAALKSDPAIAQTYASHGITR